jgi:hypothetical protein
MNEFHMEKITEFRNELSKFQNIVVNSEFEYNKSNVYRLTKIYNSLKEVQDEICIFEKDLYKPFEYTDTKIEQDEYQLFLQYIGPFLLLYIMTKVYHNKVSTDKVSTDKKRIFWDNMTIGIGN